MKKITDRELTETGLEPEGQAGRVLVIGCGALAREILAVIDANKMAHVDVTCLPAILHNHPERICPAVRETVEKHRASYQSIFVAYADCGTGGQLFELAMRALPRTVTTISTRFS